MNTAEKLVRLSCVLLLAGAAPSAWAVAGPHLNPSATAISFGSHRVGTEIAPVTLRLGNDGTEALVIQTFQTNGPFEVLGNPGASIPSGGMMSIDVLFMPTTVGSASGYLAFAHNCPDHLSPMMIPLDGTVTAPRIVTPPALQFGASVVGLTELRSMALANTGDAPLSVTALTIAGADPADFAVVEPAVLPATVDPGEALTATLSFTPSAAGPRAATLAVTSDAFLATESVVALGGDGTPALPAAPQSPSGGGGCATSAGGVSALAGLVAAALMRGLPLRRRRSGSRGPRDAEKAGAAL